MIESVQSELLDSYASALVNAVKAEPDGLGSIAEERVLAGQFSMLPVSNWRDLRPVPA